MALEPMGIRDLSQSDEPSQFWLPEINSATGGPQSHVVYHDLVRYARMRLRRTDEGRAMVAVAEQGAVHLLVVPSPEFYRFVDRFRIGRRLRVLPESALQELARVIEARVGDPSFESDLPLGLSDEGYGERHEARSSPEEASFVDTDRLAYTLTQLTVTSPYVLVPSVLALAMGQSERQVTKTFAENQDRLRELGFESRTVGSSLGPVFLVTRLPRVRPAGPRAESLPAE